MQSTTEADSDFDLDVSIVESGEVVAALMRNTDDNCGHTCPPGPCAKQHRIRLILTPVGPGTWPGLYPRPVTTSTTDGQLFADDDP